MKWNKIESIPKTTKEVLVCNMNQGGVMSLIRWDIVHNQWLNKGKYIILKATHWTPINMPEIPKEEQCFGTCNWCKNVG